METTGFLKRLIPFLILLATVLALLTLMPFAYPYISKYITTLFRIDEADAGVTAVSIFDVIYRIVRIVLLMMLIVAIIRLLNSIIFSTFLSSASYEISTLLRNVISTIIFIVAFIIILQTQFTSAYEKLAPIFTGSTIIGIVIGLALQDTLGNFFAGAAIQADNPFQVGDVINISNKGTGVVESISWRGVKIRTFQNKIIIISNSVLGKEIFEVAPKDNLNARVVFFNTLYSSSPARTAQILREVVRQVENVSQMIRPVIRIRNLGESGIDWEVKYWLDDYTKYNDTDALIRQRIWYAFQREKIEFAYPTRTIHVETKRQEDAFVEASSTIFDRINNVPIFVPLNDDEIEKLAVASNLRVFAPGEKIVRKGQKGNSMFIVHRGTVTVQVREDGKVKPIRQLKEGGFFGEMGLFTGEPRTATVVADEEAEVLEIKHYCLKPILEDNPELVESFGKIIEERRNALEELLETHESGQKVDKAGVFNSIRKFFGLRN
ncbi:MAG TPA: mechanosensitive ion channel family protein [Pyrinomonadaceae bacterium]|jgi:small-conductance mechanosensitive channel